MKVIIQLVPEFQFQPEVSVKVKRISVISVNSVTVHSLISVISGGSVAVHSVISVPAPILNLTSEDAAPNEQASRVVTYHYTD